MTSGPQSDLLTGVPWLWVEGTAPRNACAAFLRRIDWEPGQPARIHLFAETHWRLYVDGRFVAAGPAPFRKPVVTVDSVDLAPWLHPGANEIFILVRWFGMETKWVLSDRPGLAARIEVGGRRLDDAAGWTAWPLQLWNPDAARISWAREPVEDIDLRHPDAAILARHAGEDYAVAGAAAMPPPGTLIASAAHATAVRPRLVPPLRWGEVRPLAPPAVFRCNAEVYLIQDLARRLSAEHWSPAWDADLVDRVAADGSVRLDRRRGDQGWSLVYDLRRVCAGDLVVEIDSDSAGTLDLGFSELFAVDRPEVTRNGSAYVARIRLRPGRNRCRLFAFHGLRWVLLSLKDVEGTATVRDVHVRECHADLPYRDAFASSDPVVDLVQAISRRSVVLNTQATCYDCNTREIGTYWGDGVWIADIAGHMSGDFGHLRHLAVAATDEWDAVGCIRGSLYGMGQILVDYSLVPAEVLRRAWWCTGDRQLAAGVLPTLAAILADLERGCDGDGWLSVAGIAAHQRARGNQDGVILFLDHAGLGWHPRDSTAIDRRDPSAGLQLFHLQALQGMSEVARGLGAADPWGPRCAALARRIREAFTDPATGLIADSRLPGGAFAGPSQIANALAVTTRVLEGDAARRAMRACIDLAQRPDIAGSTPYGYFFICDALCRLGMVAEAVRLLRERFRPMLERRATTTWEAWGGELHDSLNHAWSAVMPWLARRGLAGLEPLQPGYGELRLAPALDALDACRIGLAIPQGPLALSWRQIGGQGRRVEVELPPGVTARVVLPGGEHRVSGSAAWDLV